MDKQAGAARNTKEIPDADKFDPNRKQPDVTGFSYGKHECFGKHLSLVFVTGMVKLAAGLKNLRPAPGPLGQVKIINVGFDKIYMNDSWSMFGFNTSSKLRNDTISHSIPTFFRCRFRVKNYAN